jgi:hypothetical protein
MKGHWIIEWTVGVVMAFCLLACLEDLIPAIIPLDHPHQSAGFQNPLDCDTLIEETDPPFITSWILIGEEYMNDIMIHVGPYHDTFDGVDITPLAPKLDSMLELFAPELDYTVFVRQDPVLHVAILVDSTNEVQWINNRRIKIEHNDVFYAFHFQQQAFMFGGALTSGEYSLLAEKYSSVRAFDYLYTMWPPSAYDKVSLKILGNCKKGRRLADFTWAEGMSDSIPPLFHTSMWQKIRI